MPSAEILAINARVLQELTPVVALEIARHEAAAQPWYPHEFVPWDEGTNFAHLGGEPWRPEQSRLGKVATTAMFVNLLTEDNLPSYHREIATRFGRDSAWGYWVGRWTAEEGRHAIAMRDFLMATRAIDPVELEDARMLHTIGGYDSGDKLPLETIAYVTMQELATRISHRNTGKACADDGEVVAEAMLTRIAKDENLHMIFYRNLLAAAFDTEPTAAVQALSTEIKKFAMPGATIPNFARHAATIAIAGIYNDRVHFDEVLTPTLRSLNVLDRDYPDDAGKIARDELATVYEIKKRAADRSEEIIKRALERQARRAS